MPNNDSGSILSGILWMFFIGVLLFWLPVIGPFIAGVVGGKKSGGVGNAIQDFRKLKDLLDQMKY